VSHIGPDFTLSGKVNALAMSIGRLFYYRAGIHDPWLFNGVTDRIFAQNGSPGPLLSVDPLY